MTYFYIFTLCVPLTTHLYDTYNMETVNKGQYATDDDGTTLSVVHSNCVVLW